MQIAAEAVAAGDVSAITPYLKVLDRLDRYQTVASANQVYDDEARKKLLDKINRIASNLGVDEVMQAAALEHLKKAGRRSSAKTARARRSRAEGGRAKPRSPDGENKRGGARVRRFRPGPEAESDIFSIFFRRNPLKSPDSDE